VNPGLAIEVVDRDDDYLGINISAANDRYVGQTHIYAGGKQLTEFAGVISGFPSKVGDERYFEFGSREPKFAGGYMAMVFSFTFGSGHTKGYPQVAITIEDDKGWYSEASASFSIKFEPAALDRFVSSLREIENAMAGEATLAAIN
jgi:hypothetical protein